MTTTRILRKFFKKFFNIDAEGSSVTSILENVVENNDDIGSGSPGGGSNVMVVHEVYNKDEFELQCILDKTWREIYDAFNAGTMVILRQINIFIDLPEPIAIACNSIDELNEIINNHLGEQYNYEITNSVLSSINHHRDAQLDVNPETEEEELFPYDSYTVCFISHIGSNTYKEIVYYEETENGYPFRDGGK